MKQKYQAAKIVFPDGAFIIVPIEVVEKSRASYYKDIDHTTMNESLEDTRTTFNTCPEEIENWILNNMDLEELSREHNWTNRDSRKSYSDYKKLFGEAEVKPLT